MNLNEFGKWRSIFWPIHRYELKKVLPMFLLFFLISFNYNILRNTKEALIVTAEGSGAETILFIKSWLVLPSSIIFTLIYAKLSNVLSKKALFFTVISPFVLFFTIFPLLLYPNRQWLHPNESAHLLQSILPQGFMGLIAIYRHWTYAIFFELAELWGSFMLALMFWGFSNEITKVKEAKRFYAIFGIGANFALLMAGFATVYVSDIRQSFPEGVDSWGISLNYLMFMVVLSCFGIMLTYWWINGYVLTDPRYYDPYEQMVKKKEKPKMSLKQSFFYLAQSPYIGFLALLVIGYGISINIVEVTWKSQLKIQYPHSNDYNTFMGYFSFMTGVVSLLMLFVGGAVIRRFGWGVAALITPLVLLVSGILFFGSLIVPGIPILLAVYIGTFQNIVTKSCKYSLFDPTKEMAYIPLDQEQKVKGKASIDVIGARLGKASGSLIQQGLIISFGSMSAITPYLAMILMGVIIIWMVSAQALNKRFNALTLATK